MKQSLTYEDWCKILSRMCSRCNGTGTYIKNNINQECSCQALAKIKYRLDQIEIYPEKIKTCAWTDFSGYSHDGKQILHLSNAHKNLKKAMEYCFDPLGESVLQIKDKILSDRKKYLVIQNHIKDGQSVVISGENQSGKTLLAALILQEIAHACVLFNLKITFDLVHASELLDAARWNDTKSIETHKLNDWADLDFMFIDDLDCYVQGNRLTLGGHTGPPDYVAMTNLFVERAKNKRPTILICSPDFLGCAKDYSFKEDFLKLFGAGCYNIVNDSDTLVLELKKAV